MCKSKWGYWGLGPEYCGEGCQAGPCHGKDNNNNNNNNGGGNTINEGIFNCIFNGIDGGKQSRYWGVFQRARQGALANANTNTMAVFLAHVFHETDGLKTMVEYCSQTGTCSNYQESWCGVQPVPGRQYYGRGWFQLSYPCNYHGAGRALNADLLNNPDLVANNDDLAIGTALWFWNTNNMGGPASQANFGQTTRILNTWECSGSGGHHLQARRVETYQRVRGCFGMGRQASNLSC